ncbi:hypothetical protein P7K49_032757, partial [Saguinus oedipus]
SHCKRAGSSLRELEPTQGAVTHEEAASTRLGSARRVRGALSGPPCPIPPACEGVPVPIATAHSRQRQAPELRTEKGKHFSEEWRHGGHASGSGGTPGALSALFTGGRRPPQPQEVQLHPGLAHSAMVCSGSPPRRRPAQGEGTAAGHRSRLREVEVPRC